MLTHGLSYYRPFLLVKFNREARLVSCLDKFILLEEWLVNKRIEIFTPKPTLRCRRANVEDPLYFLGVFAFDFSSFRRSLVRDDLANGLDPL